MEEGKRDHTVELSDQDEGHDAGQCEYSIEENLEFEMEEERGLRLE